MNGKLSVISLGPGADDLITPRAQAMLQQASDIVGYGPYVARIPVRDAQQRHVSDNRVELERAQQALQLAANGAHVALVSSGDAGVFAMASSLFEVFDRERPTFDDIDIEIFPGISAMFAAAARIGAPLGHDFCAISLSDNLKTWDTVLMRLESAARADFVIALYNPRSVARPWQLGAAFDQLKQIHPPTVPVMFATQISTENERIVISSLHQADPSLADMRTVVIIGSTNSKIITTNGKRWVYTSRYGEDIAAG